MQPTCGTLEKVGKRPIAKSRGIPLQSIADYWSLDGIVAPALLSNSPTRAASDISRTYMSAAAWSVSLVKRRCDPPGPGASGYGKCCVPRGPCRVPREPLVSGAFVDDSCLDVRYNATRR